MAVAGGRWTPSHSIMMSYPAAGGIIRDMSPAFPTPLNEYSAPDAGQPRAFATTRWSLVAAAGGGSPEDRRLALAELCQSYWYPLYAYVRRRGHSADESQELTQEFFLQLIEKDSFRVAERQRGKFHSFLLASLNHFLANQWRDARAQKRGGGRPLLSLDFAAGESRYRAEPAHDLTPERVFERRWALELLERALARLRDNYERLGKLPLYEQLKPCLAGAEEAPTYHEAAERLCMTESAVKVAVHRMRERCRRVLRDEIAQTVADPAEVDDELRHLFDVLS